MARWDEITPVLYGITKKIAPPIIREKWDDWITPILRNQRKIHKHLFATFAFMRLQGSNADAGYNTCADILEVQGVTFENDKIRDAIFDVYWDLAENNDYWQQDNYALIGKELPYDDMLKKWKENNQSKIQWCKESLEQWLNNN